jgi:putative ABC transport system ATP-binding protein
MLLSILGLTPKGGTYELDGADVSRLTTAERSRVRNRSIGFIFQNFNLIGDLTVAENVELPLTYRGLSAAERRRRVAESLDRLAMSHRARHFPSQLSGGQGEAVMGLLSGLHAAGSTIVMVTHDRRFNRYASRTIGLLDGRIVPEHVAAAF